MKTLCLILALLGLTALAHAQPAATPSSLAVPWAKPGTRAAAQIAPQGFAKAPSGLWVPDHRFVVVDKKAMHDQAVWNGTRQAVRRHLVASGARLAPLSYQRLVVTAAKRAEAVLRRQGLSLASWKFIAIEGGPAEAVNAGAWTGGLVTINRPLIDLSFQIASVVTAAGSREAVDLGLHRLGLWRRGRGPKPEALDAAPHANRDAMAEGIVAGVVMHEMGHAASGHMEIQEPKLWLPGQPLRRERGPQDMRLSRAHEWEADRFSVKLGAAGGARTPGAIPLFDYYMFIDHPRTQAKGRYDLADMRSHPLDLHRYVAARAWLTALLPKKAAGLPDPRQLWIPDSARPATTTVAPTVAPAAILPPAPVVQAAAALVPR